MNIGYACINLSIDAQTSKSCILRNASEERLKELTRANLSGLERIIRYNIEKNIMLFRISSGLVPFASHPANTLRWWDEFKPEFESIASLIKKSGMRVSMHPGQYTVLNSPRPEVVKNAVADLVYHCRVLDLLTDSSQHKIILHVGGVYGDKSAAIERFARNYSKLPENVKKRLVVENDEKSYCVDDVLLVSSLTGAPAVFDNLHNSINPSDGSEKDLVLKCAHTWGKSDGIPKLHYSQQDPAKRKGAHSGTIMPDSFFCFLREIDGIDADIMLEVKDKNISAEKIIALMAGRKGSIHAEWAKYKYSVMEKSYAVYRKLGRSIALSEISAKELFCRINEILSLSEDSGQAANALEHVWGYFKRLASNDEKYRFHELLESYKSEKTPLHEVKEFLSELSVEYEISYIRDSYY